MPRDKIIGWYPKTKLAPKTKHYDVPNIGLIKGKKGKTIPLF